MSDKYEESGLFEQTWSVSELIDVTEHVLHEIFPKEIWLCGVLSGYKENSGKHRYFKLLEYEGNSRTICASVDAVAFYSDRLRIAKTLRQSRVATPTGGSPIEFRDNLPVKVLVQPTLYKQTGRFQVIVRDIDPYYTTGVMREHREEVIAAMRDAGIAHLNMELPLPVLPLRIALVTSRNGEAIHDFMRELGTENAPFEVELFDTRVQGRDVEVTVCRALQEIAERREEFDVTCIIRGGGSVQDLSYFDTERIAEAVCLHPVKVIIGIGHERDQTALDALAFSVKTPTAAAARLVDLVRFQKQRLGTFIHRINIAASHKLDLSYLHLRQLTQRLSISTLRALGRPSLQIDRMVTRLDTAAQKSISDKKLALETRVSQLTSALHTYREREESKLKKYEALVKFAHNHATYAYSQATVRVTDAKTHQEVASVLQVKSGNQLLLRFPDGYLVVRVDSVVPIEGGKIPTPEELLKHSSERREK